MVPHYRSQILCVPVVILMSSAFYWFSSCSLLYRCHHVVRFAGERGSNDSCRQNIQIGFDITTRQLGYVVVVGDP